MYRKICSLGYQLKASIDKRVENFGAQYIAFGIFGVLNYPIYYVIWSYGAKQSYESLILRGIATILSVLLLLKNNWPEKLRTWLPVYWYITLIYCLPFFFTYMLFKTHAAEVWLMSTSTVFFWLVLLVDWVSYVVILTIGIVAAIVLYYFTDGTINIDHYGGYLAQYIGVFVVVSIFAHNRERLEKMKLTAASAVGASIAHELHTPIRSIKSTFTGIKDYVPKFMRSHQLAKDAGLPVDDIRRDRYQALEIGIAKTDRELDYAQTIIDILLKNVNQRNSFEHHKITLCSKGACIERTLERYPFNPEKQASRVHWEKEEDFQFNGNELLMMHVLFNLLKNALHFIGGEKGEIYISLKKGERYNTLCFKDTGEGIPKHILPKLFTRFFTTTINGTGLGLAFCKLVMEGWGGDIKCESELGVYTQFTLSFPKPNQT